MKACFKCHRTLPLADYYKHKEMADGHLNKCKECTKADAAAYRAANPELILARKLEWSRTEKGRATMKRCIQNRKAAHPDRDRANTAASNAIKLGKLIPQPCFVCGAAKVEGHHPDYSAPLDVVWLCKKHHVEVHKLARQLNRKETK
jgi:hypothetical protein